jgi:hypothetical protein
MRLSVWTAERERRIYGPPGNDVGHKTVVYRSIIDKSIKGVIDKTDAYITANRRIQYLLASWARTMWLRRGLGFTRHHRTFRSNVLLHANVGILSNRYSNWRVAQWA